MDTRLFHKRLFDAARTLIPRGMKVVCAVSGGADSMALLHGLHRVNVLRKCGWKLHVAHLDHNLPSNAAAMMKFVEETAASLGLPFSGDREDVIALSRKTAESIETCGRRVRYDFLERIAVEQAAQYIAVAHHADDQAETILQRIVRGTGLRGLSAMASSRPIRAGSDILVVRPLLDFRKDQLVSYLRRREMEFFHDATNDDIHAASRNRVRHEVLPLLTRTMNPKAVDALVRLASQAKQSQAALRAIAEREMVALTVVSNKDGVTLHVAPFARLERALQCEVLILALEQLGVPLGDRSFERIEAATSAGCGDGRRRRIELPGGYLVERRGKFLHIGRREALLRAARRKLVQAKESCS